MKTSIELKKEIEETKEKRTQTWNALKRSRYNSINNPFQQKLFSLSTKVKKLEKEYSIALEMEYIALCLKQLKEKYGEKKAIDVFNT